MSSISPGLYGLKHSNRDFSKSRNWGKNIFNNAFPAALTCYFSELAIQPVYLTFTEQTEVTHTYIKPEDVFGIHPSLPETFFAFESDFTPFRSLVVDYLPRADLVVLNDKTGTCRSALEIKLTALPDNSTYDFSDELFGCELVVRPDTVVYLALNIADQFRNQRTKLQDLLSELPQIRDWSDIAEVSPVIPQIADALDFLLLQTRTNQKPLVLQPVWKTQGRSLLLHEDAFDVFVWSDYAFTRLFFRDRHNIRGKPSRSARTITWLAKMLLDFANTGKIDHRQVIDEMSFNTKNDKAFSVAGRITQPFMASPELTKPRLKKDILRHVILGGGEQYLSPERRLDAAILSTPGLFE